VRQVEAARIVAGTDLRRRVRNRSFIIRAFVGPVVLATIITLAFGGGDDFSARIGVVDADGSPVGTGFVAALTRASDAGGLHFVAVDTTGTARARVARGSLDAAVVVPRGFGASLAGGDPDDVEVLASSDAVVSAEVATAVARQLTTRAAAARLAVATARATDAPPPDVGRVTAGALPVAVDARSSGGRVSPAAYLGPAMGLLFLFLSIGTLARDLMEDRRIGLLDRLRAGPVGASAIIGGRGLAVVAVGATGLVVIWAFTAAVLGADWGDPVGVVAVIGAASLAVAGIAGLVAAVARTEQAAETISLAVGFGFAVVGGAFIPLGQLPPLLGHLAPFTPMGEALAAFALLSAGDAAPVEVLPYVAALLAWAAVTGVIAVRLLPARLGAR
jgi:linearmycin/streptolysin S transport system permease protein